MKDARFITAILLAGALSTTAQQPPPIAPAPVLPQPKVTKPAAPVYTLTTNKDWQNPAALRDTLSKKILARLSSTEEADVKKFLQSQSNRLLLANWQLANAEILSEPLYEKFTTDLNRQLNTRRKNLENLEKELPELGESAQAHVQYQIQKLKAEIAGLEAELKQPVRLADVVKRPRASRLINLIANDLGWIGDIVYSGECQMPGRMLNMLANMMERYTRMLPNDRIPRDIATATALEFARYGWTVDAACKRAEYFVRNWRQDRLHAGFDKLPFWQRRVVCGWKGNHSSGTPESLEWALYNVNLPDERYTGCCWRCGYVLNNVYGDSIHGPYYAGAFDGLYEGEHHRFTQEVGGVCGGLSHFGAAAACANGVPALTAGEPGHCAYIVLVDNKWTPAYSLSWQRGVHWQPWHENYTFATLHLTTDLYSPAQKQATRLSNAYRVLAHLYATNDEAAKAIDCFLKAEDAQPLHYPVYREHSELLKRTHADSPIAWMQLNDSLCRNLVPKYAECAAVLAQNNLYEPLQKSGASAEQLQAAFDAFWMQTADLGPDRWSTDELLNKQISILNNSRKGQEQENTCAVFRSMLTNTISKQAYAPIALDGGNALMKKMDDTGKARILEIMTQAITSGSGMSPEIQLQALNNAVLAAEGMRDPGAFQSISKLIPADKSHDNRPIEDFEPFPGILVSEGGMVYASSTSQWDRPATHANVLTKLGGQIHTNRDKDAWVAVKLPRHSTISGVVIAAHKNNSNWHRLNNMQIQISETGKDDDWHNVGQPTGQCTQRLIRVDLGSELPKALYVRILRPSEGHDVFHVDGIFIYGSPAA